MVRSRSGIGRTVRSLFQAIDDSDPDPVITLEIEKSRQIQNNLRENHKDL